jgi:hypothetical protein
MTDVHLNALRAHFAKELRDQRGNLLRLALVVTPALLAGGWTLPEHAVRGNQYTTLALVLCALLGALAVAIDVVPSEGARGTIALLARLPRGLSSAFWAKGTLVVLALLAFGWLGYAGSAAVRLLRYPDEAALPPPWLPQVYFGALAYAFWVLAVTSWMPRGLPALFVPPLLLTPHALVLSTAQGQQPNPVAIAWLIESDLGWLVPLELLLGIALGWVSFVLGRRWSGGVRASVALGLLAAVLALAPAWGALLARRSVWLAPPPAEATSSSPYQSTMLGTGGKFALTSLCRHPGWPSHACAIELASGKRTWIGGPWSLIHQGCPGGWSWPHLEEFVTVFAPGDDSVVLESATLEPLPGAQRSPEASERMRAALREHTPMRLPGDRRAWILDSKLEVGGPDGTYETVTLPKGHFAILPVGQGLLVSHGGGNFLVWDFTRGRLVTSERFSSTNLWCLGKHWLVPRKDGAWEMLDPDTGARGPVAAELARGNVLFTLQDGRVAFACNDSGRRGPVSGVSHSRIVLARFPDGPCEELALPEGFHAPQGWSARLLYGSAGEEGPDGERLLALQARGGPSWVTALRPDERRLRGLVRAGRVVGRLDRDTLLVDDGALERVDLRTGARRPIPGGGAR